MKLAVFTSRYPAKTATFFERDMRSLLEAGVELDVYCLSPLEPALWDYSRGLLETPGFNASQVHHAGLARSLARSRAAVLRRPGAHLADAARILLSALPHGPVAFAKTAYALPKAWAWAAGTTRYDHVLAYWGNYAGTAAWAFHRLQGADVPFSIWLHAGVDLYRTPVFMRQKLAYADNILTCCDFNRGFIQQQFGAANPALAARVHVFHHGLDLDEYQYADDGREDRVIMAVGRLVAHKGFDYLVRAAALLAARGVAFTLEFVGEGPERQNLEALARSLGVSGMVRFTGWLTPQGARRAMSRATVLVHPSDGLGDGLPNVVREAMAVGTPVIASDVAGIPDALSDGCGVLVPPKEPVPLADAIERLLADAGLRRDIARAARHRVEARYDRRINGARLADLLRRTQRLASPRTAPALDTAAMHRREA